jgi:TolB-like protein
VRIVHVALVTGLFVATVVAWFHAEKGRQRIGWLETTLIIFIFATGGLVVAALLARSRGSVEYSPDVPAERYGVIAVLPFDNYSVADSMARFADGIQEDIISSLARSSQLTVRSRASTDRYRLVGATVPEIARELQARYLIRGSARAAAGRARIVVELLEGTTETRLWHAQFDRDLTVGNMLDVQRDIGTEVARALATQFEPEDTRVGVLRGLLEDGDWTGIVTMVDTLPGLAALPQAANLYAMALNRRNEGGDRDSAIAVITKLIASTGGSGHEYGTLGRIYKDLYSADLERGDSVGAANHLNLSIETYRRGFERNPEDFYPGVNAITLLLTRGDDAALHEIAGLLPLVRGAVGPLTDERTFWETATGLQLAAVARDWTEANVLAKRVASANPQKWMVETIVRDLRLVGPALRAAADSAQLSALVTRLTSLF